MWGWHKQSIISHQRPHALTCSTKCAHDEQVRASSLRVVLTVGNGGEDCNSKRWEVANHPILPTMSIAYSHVDHCLNSQSVIFAASDKVFRHKKGRCQCDADPSSWLQKESKSKSQKTQNQISAVATLATNDPNFLWVRKIFRCGRLTARIGPIHVSFW